MTLLPFDRSSFVWGGAGLATGDGITDLEKSTILDDIADLQAVVVPTVIDDMTDVDTSGKSTGDLMQWDGSNWVPFTLEDIEYQVALEVVIDGAGSVITTGVKCDLRIPFNFEVTEWGIFADTAGAIAIDIWKDTYGNYPPTDADSVTGSEVPNIPATNNKYAASSLTGWDTTWDEDDLIRINVDSVTSITRCTLVIYGNRTIAL